MEASHQQHHSLASYIRCKERIDVKWPAFLDARADRLRHGGESEKVAEAILEDLFTDVLDWSKGDLTYQVGYADIVISKNLAKYMVVEVKRPGTLFPGRRAFETALDQARRYADEQRISLIGVSDGRHLYAANIDGGGLKERVMLDLGRPDAPHSLWWLSVHGIYRPCTEPVIWAPTPEPTEIVPDIAEGSLLHPKYRLPSTCFAYVGDANKPSSWKLPHRLANGQVDERRLPKAIQAILSNYRGVKVGGIPEQALPDVLLRLARAAQSVGRYPPSGADSAQTYRQLAAVLDQLRLSL